MASCHQVILTCGMPLTFIFNFQCFVSTSAVKVGLTSQSAAEITANIEAAMPHIIEKIPRKWKNIQSINLKTNDSTALPIFNSLPDEGVTRIEAYGKRSNALAMDEDEDEDEDEEDDE